MRYEGSLALARAARRVYKLGATCGFRGLDTYTEELSQKVNTSSITRASFFHSWRREIQLWDGRNLR